MELFLSADNDRELLDKLKSKSVHVPARSEGRKSIHTEQYAICYFLSSASAVIEFVYPIVVYKTERPDFLVCFGNKEIGVEHTECIPENEAYIRRKMEEHKGGPYFSLHFNHEDEGKSKKEIEALLKASDVVGREENEFSEDEVKLISQNPPGMSWVGDKPEREWANSILYCVTKKSESICKDGFKKCSENWLLLFDAFSGPVSNEDKARRFLLEKFPNDLEFSKILILSNKDIVVFQYGKYTSSPQIDLWS